ncbi:MurR/RpiR family transcriptional regulator [Marinilactibacillus sp. Marseille-P9653]|uniref:MurR/RpiR family transcriptional regulator n=1 Tax=Marinilactibacillus sp. Marseille-P9653 TaxID=2866583 RepID=UPI001CE4A465|nr:MurR/RpiR family transcriptional regulator [Marinilactibacillus sp. Marseille-P9653]
MLLIDKLKRQEGLTPTDKQIANYILEHITSIPSTGIEVLAKQTYSSHSAIVRLSKKLGFDGYKQFRLALSETVYKDLHQLGKVDANFPFDSTDTTSQISQKMADLSIEAIRRASEQLTPSKLDTAAEILMKADRIFLFAQGDSQIRARSFQNKMVKLNRFLVIAEDYADQAWNAANLSKNDCAVFITYSAKIPQYDQYIKYFAKEGVPTILLTGNPTSSLHKIVDLSIVATQDEYDFLKVGTFSSQVAFEYILDTVFSVLYAKDYQKNLMNLKQKQRIIEKGELADLLHPDVE